MIIEIKYQTNEGYVLKKTKDKILQQQNDRYIHFKDLVRSYIELDSRLKAMEKSFKMFFKK